MSKYRITLLVVLACFLVHGGIATFFFPHELQFTKYSQAAFQYVAHALPSERMADFSPFYLYAHVLVQKLWPGSKEIMLWVQLVATALAAGGLFLLLTSTLPVSLSLVGVVLFAFSPSVITYACIYEPEAFLLLFLIGFVYLSTKEGEAYCLFAGAFLALCLLTRPNLVPLLFLAPLFFFMQSGRARWLRFTLIFALLPVVALAALSLRNARAFDGWSPIVMNPGYVFFEGNNPLSSGQSAVYPPLIAELKSTFTSAPDTPHVIYREVARRSSGRDFSIAEVNAYWARKALNFIVDYPWHSLRGIATKAHFAIHEFRRFDLEVAYKFSQQLKNTGVPATPFSVVLPLSILGLWAARHRWVDYLLPGLVIFCQFSVMLLLYVSDRQRLITIPFLVLFACVGIQQLSRWHWRWRLGAVAALALFSGALTVPTGRMMDTLHWWKNYGVSDKAWIEAIRLRAQANFEEAAKCAVESLASAPWLIDSARPGYLSFGEDVSAFGRLALEARRQVNKKSPSDDFDRAILMEEVGEWEEAERLLKTLISVGHVFDRESLQSSQPGYFLAKIAASRGEKDHAIHLALESLSRAPGDPYLLALLAALTEDQYYERLLVRYFGEVEAAFWIGRSCLELGQFHRAVANFTYVVEVLPEFRRAQIHLAAAYAGIGEDERGAILYDWVSTQSVDPVMLEDHIVPLYLRRVQSMPDDPLRRFRLGAVLAHYGHLEQAIAEQRLAFSLTGDENMHRSIRWLEKMAQLGSLGNNSQR